MHSSALVSEHLVCPGFRDANIVEEIVESSETGGITVISKPKHCQVSSDIVQKRVGQVTIPQVRSFTMCESHHMRQANRLYINKYRAQILTSHCSKASPSDT
jgi:hypothetical protein